MLMRHVKTLNDRNILLVTRYERLFNILLQLYYIIFSFQTGDQTAGQFQICVALILYWKILVLLNLEYCNGSKFKNMNGF